MKAFESARKLGPALFSVALLSCSLAGCNQPAQTTSAEAVAAVPPPPPPPAVPQFNRTPDQEERWQRYLAAKQAYEQNLARARNEGRQEQAAMDTGRQAVAFDAGRQNQAHVDQAHVDQGRVDQAQRELAQANRQASLERDPHRRDQIVNQARANLAAAQQGR